MPLRDNSFVTKPDSPFPVQDVNLKSSDSQFHLLTKKPRILFVETVFWRNVRDYIFNWILFSVFQVSKYSESRVHYALTRSLVLRTSSTIIASINCKHGKAICALYSGTNVSYCIRYFNILLLIIFVRCLSSTYNIFPV